MSSSRAGDDARRRLDVEELHRWAVERFLTEMRGREEAGLSVREMAEIVCLSPFHFARVFREVTASLWGVLYRAKALRKVCAALPGARRTVWCA